MSRERQRVIPVPAIAHGKGPFRIRESSNGGGFCDFRDKIFSAPLRKDSITARAVRTHEYGHLITDRIGLLAHKKLMKECAKAGIDQGWANAAADAVVNTFMLTKDLGEIRELPLCLPDDEALAYVPKYTLAQTLLRTDGTKVRMEVKWKLRDLDLLTYEEVNLIDQAAISLSELSCFEKPIRVPFVLTLLSYLQTVFGPFDQPITLAGAGDGFEKVPSSLVDQGLVNQLSSLIGSQTFSGVWGTMEEVHPPLSKPCQKALQALRHKPGFVGPFRFPHRALLPSGDGMAFAHKRRAQGGTVLIDMSGSMAITESQISELLERIPAVRVAGYASAEGDMTRGRLVLLANRGFRVNNVWQTCCSLLGNGNIVDGPALQWLRKQIRPLVWLSDGTVTGVDDFCSAQLTSEAISITRTGGIKRVATLNDLLGFIGRHGRLPTIQDLHV